MEDATEKKARKFKVGDRVYAPFHGYGVVTKIHDHACAYPIEVTWDSSAVEKMEDVSTFTANGYLVQDATSPTYTLTVVESAMPKDAEEDERMETKFNVGDRVYAKYRGYGIVTAIYKGTSYPVEVTWDEHRFSDINLDRSTFTKDGCLSQYYDKGDTHLRVVTKEDEKMGANGTKDGEYYADDSEPERDIYPLKIFEELDEGTVDRMMNALDKKTEDAINPAHYKVKGLPEAHEIINHLMHREQYEGFLWGNIIKYAYRYGRKGDKAETAGKIAWYATKLKELEECEEEKEDD